MSVFGSRFRVIEGASLDTVGAFGEDIREPHVEPYPFDVGRIRFKMIGFSERTY